MGIALAVFGAALAATRMVSVGSIAGAIAFPLAARALGAPLDVALREHNKTGELLGKALAEAFRVLRPGGTFACTVPTWYPEKINWLLSDEYHAPKSVGGHVRIYSATELKAKLRTAGLRVTGSHHAHALHSPYWWLKCAVGPRNEQHPLVTRYRKLLEWEIFEQPTSMKVLERTLAPVMGKSFIVYGVKQ